MIGIVGLGNPLMGDDGFGIVVVDLLKKMYIYRPSVELIDGGVGGFSLPLHKFHRLIIVDVVVDNEKNPGDIVIYSKGDLLSNKNISQKISLHDVSLQDLLLLLDFREELPEEIFLVGVIPLCLKDMRIGLSPLVRNKIFEVVEKVIEILNLWNVEVKNIKKRVKDVSWYSYEGG